ncbi:tetratricopeptide repeat protein [Jiangella anatolica]|uniref:Tetratricopeptide repeat protein n=1 Tax=Jiangella anatolica TaxID=2670374 RepID=A0A2W2B473_9ACTN|nr:hypothetical protein [Jiangella anatolica]PZF82175.1 hypothetical protein C1I92_17905 [Jiangella anatolica]
MNEELVDRLRQAENAPYGKARSALLEDVVRRADAAGEDDLAFYSRLSLVTAYVLGGEPRKSLVPFARCVADWDADPGRYQRHSHKFHWCFKYAPSTMTKFPEVPLDRTYAVLDDMERRWRAGGHSMHAVHQHRWLVAHHIGDVQAAAEQFRLWSTAPRDGLSDCAGCDPTSKVHHLTSAGRTADAVALGLNVLDGQYTCEEQPQELLTALLPAYVAEGMQAEAVDAHRKAYRILRGRAGRLREHADHIMFLARTGNEVKAVELIERHLGETADPSSPHAEMMFAAAAAHALGRAGDLAIRQPKAAPVLAAELGERLAGRALELAAQFDERNRTTHTSDVIRAMLTAEPWLDYLPLSETARRARLHQQASPPPAPVTVAAEEAEPATPAGRGWLDRAEDAWHRGAYEEAAAAWQGFEQEVAESDWTPVDRARVLDGRGLMAQNDPEVAQEAWREALELYAASGEEVRARRDRARIGRVLCAGGQVDEGLATAEEPAHWLLANDEPRRRAYWQYSLAIMYAQAGRPEDALGELTELRRRTDVDDDLRSAAVIAECDMLAQLGRLEEAEAAATAGLGSSDAPQRSAAYKQRGWLRVRLERPAEAVDDLIEAVALAAGTPGAEVHVALCRVELARAYLMTGRTLEAAETGEEALTVLDRTPGLADPLEDVRGLLLNAYRALGERESALTKVRELLAAAPPEAHPAWLGMVRQDEGLLLQQLDRDEAAVDSFLAAASFYVAAEQPVDQVQAVRLAGQSAAYLGNVDQALELLERVRLVLDALPSADPLVLFQTAGVEWDLAMIALRRGETDAAVRHATRAAELYERGGHDDMHASARLLIAEHGSTDEKQVEQLFTSLPEGHDLWYRAGWLLVDRLNAQGRTHEAATLESRLTE